MSVILVPLDFSSCAVFALEEAMAQAAAFKAELVLLHVGVAPGGLPPATVVHPSVAPGERDAGDQTVAVWLARDGRAGLAPLQARAASGGTRVRSRVELGRVADTILRVAREEGCRSIVMGTHARSGLAHAFFGSVAEEVIRKAEVPVITVRTRHRPSCHAQSCALCTEGQSPAEQALQGEGDG